MGETKTKYYLRTISNVNGNIQCILNSNNFEFPFSKFQVYLNYGQVNSTITTNDYFDYKILLPKCVTTLHRDKCSMTLKIWFDDMRAICRIYSQIGPYIQLMGNGYIL